MKKSTLVMLILFVLSGILYYYYSENTITRDSPKQVSIMVARVIDGDTIELSNGERVRLLGINTPEKKTYLSNESLDFTRRLENKTISVEITEKDKYGRNLGYVFYENKLFNEEILRNGFAHVYIYDDDKYSDRLRSAEEKARNAGIGIWEKSANFGCISVVEFIYLDVKETDNEILILKNSCKTMNVLIKDDATHMYKETLKNGIFEMTTNNIWNDAGDTLFIWGDDGLLVFKRY